MRRIEIKTVADKALVLGTMLREYERGEISTRHIEALIDELYAGRTIYDLDAIWCHLIHLKQ